MVEYALYTLFHWNIFIINNYSGIAKVLNEKPNKNEKRKSFLVCHTFSLNQSKKKKTDIFGQFNLNALEFNSTIKPIFYLIIQ